MIAQAKSPTIFASLSSYALHAPKFCQELRPAAAVPDEGKPVTQGQSQFIIRRTWGGGPAIFQVKNERGLKVGSSGARRWGLLQHGLSGLAFIWFGLWMLW